MTSWEDSDSSKTMSEKLFSDAEYCIQVMMKYADDLPVGFGLTNKDLVIAAKELNNILHIPIKLKPYV